MERIASIFSAELRNVKKWMICMAFEKRWEVKETDNSSFIPWFSNPSPNAI
jgi:hypothetical protein